MKQHILFILMFIMACAQIVHAANSKEEQLKLLEKLEKLDMLDKLDRLDFQDAIDSANTCTEQRRFSCTLNHIAKAEELAETPEQKDLIQYARQDYDNEKSEFEYEQEVRRMEEEFERKERIRQREEEERQEEAEREQKRQALRDHNQRLAEKAQEAREQWAQDLGNRITQWGEDMQRSNQLFNQTLNRNINDANNFKERQADERRRAEQVRRDHLEELREQKEQRRLAYQQEQRAREQRELERKRRDMEREKEQKLRAIKNLNNQSQPAAYVKDCSLIRMSIASKFGYQKKEASCYFNADGSDRAKSDIRTCIVALDNSYSAYSRSVFESENRLECLKEKQYKGSSNTIEK